MDTALAITPLAQTPVGTWTIPGSKSITNRALILASLAEGTSILEGVLESDDTRYMRQALQHLGISIESIAAEQLLVRGGRSHLQATRQELFIGNSGTSIRFLTALACLVPGRTHLCGDAHMAKRPIADLANALRQLHLPVSDADGYPPVVVDGGRLPGGTVHMRGNRSSQYFSALLMAAGCAEAPLHIRIEGELVSRPYVDMTQRMITAFGGTVHEEADGSLLVHPCGQYRSRSYRVEPDASAASYPFALAAAGAGRIRVPHLQGDSLQGDVGFVDVLARMGATVSRDSHGITVSATAPLQGTEVDMHHISDTVMTLAAIAPLCQGPTTIYNIANIRLKETDRLQATVTELKRLGQGVSHGQDWLRIEPAPITPATVHCYDDHRMAMSFALLGLLQPGISIADPGCVAKTYPGFWDDVTSFRRRLSEP
jgi:3-phosphoshikimate 1-carboxyvinyltransferase